jgi:hypothetical protein
VVTGRYPVLTVQQDDLVAREYGFQCSVIWLLVPRPFISYSGKYVVWYVGTQPTGIFGLKFNLHLSRHSLPDHAGTVRVEINSIPADCAGDVAPHATRRPLAAAPDRRA